MQRELSAQLGDAPAFEQAGVVWQRYRGYLTAVERMVQAGDRNRSGTSDLDFAALRLLLDQREGLARRELGDWSDAFFGDEFARQRYDLGRLEIAQDATLSAGEKAARYAALEQQLPSDLRIGVAARTRQQEAAEAVSAINTGRISESEGIARIAQTLGAEAAERVETMRRAEAAWREKYDRYASERAALEGASLAAQDRDAAIRGLQQRYFTSTAESARAASLDQRPAVNQR